MKKSFSELISEIGVKGTFSETGNTFFISNREGSFNDVFNLFNHLNKLNSYYERFEKIGKETITIQEMKYSKDDIVFHVVLKKSKEGIYGVVKEAKIIHPFELLKRSNTMTKKYVVEDRIVVNMGSKKKPSYFLAEIVKVKEDKFRVEFDDGETETIDEESIVGKGIAKKCKKEINAEFLDDYLEEEEEVVAPSKKKKPIVEEDENEDDSPKKKKKPSEEEVDYSKLLANLLIDLEEIKEACNIVIEKITAATSKEVIEAKSDKKKPPVVEEDDNWLDE